MMGLYLRRIVLSGVVFANNKAKRLAIRLTRWTGKSREYVHPKHLLGETEQNYWYLAHIAPDATVLDVGCGNGMHSLKAARRCREVVGVDASLDSLGVALRTGRTLPSPNAAFFAADLEQGLPVQGSRFDTVICLDLLEHVYQRDLLLTEIRRALKPGGSMLLSVPNRGTSWKRRLNRAGLFAYSDPDHKIEYTLEELEEELARNGFRIAHLHPTVYDTPLIGAIDLVGGLSLGLYRRLTVARRRLARRYPQENAGFFAVCATK
jgi:2-polyprenyl-3-methyl-5-hydroxy-6-metoxy-1,4-benzoquinol methylase